MSAELAAKYANYKKWLRQRHLENETWVLNWDLQQNQFAEFGKGDALFFTSIFLVALVLEKNEAEAEAALRAVNAQKYAPGMYPRYYHKFNTSKDQYYPLLAALIYGHLLCPGNALIKETLHEIIQTVAGNDYKIKNPDGSNSESGDMNGFRPIFAMVEGHSTFSYFLSMWLAPNYSATINLAEKSYFNNFMLAWHYLMCHVYATGFIKRWLLKKSAGAFAERNANNPFFLMVRDLISGSKEHQAEVEKILRVFSGEHLPNDKDDLAHSDVLWQRDPRNWATPKPELRHEYAGIDYMILYQFYARYYLGDEKLSH